MSQVLTKKEIKNISVLPFQRQAILRATLVKSMTKYGFLGSILMLKTSIIDGVERLYIVDGQHRFLAAQYLNLDVKADIIESVTTKDELVKLISTLNSTGVKWTSMDYINAYAALGMKEYIDLINVCKKCTKLTALATIKIIRDACVKPLNANIKTGELLLSKELIDAILELNTLLHHIPKLNVLNMIGIYRTIISGKYDRKTFITNFNKNLDILMPLLPEEKHRIYKSWF